MEGSEPGDRKEIRRPMNAFLIFCKRHRSMVREKNPHLDNRSVTRILGELWANLNDQDKTVYTDLAKQYKEAFMKANPDYKWHNPEKICAMSIKPVQVKPPTLLRGGRNASDPLSPDSIVPGKLADPSNMGGLNLLLMAGEQSLTSKSHTAEAELHSTEPIFSLKAPVKDEVANTENTALLELAEMCSTQLVDSSKTSKSQKPKPEKFSYIDSVVTSSICSQAPAGSTVSLIPSPVISSVSANTSKSSAHCPACKTSSRSSNQLLYNLIAEKPDTCVLSKENNNDEQKEVKHGPDKSEDKIMSCDKNVVNHIIDQLFTRDSSAKVTPKPLMPMRMSHHQVEAVVKERLKALSAPQSIEECMTKIITEAYATQIQGDLRRDKQTVTTEQSQAPVSKSVSENSLMSQMLRTGSYKPPAKVSQENHSPVLKSPPSLQTNAFRVMETSPSLETSAVSLVGTPLSSQANAASLVGTPLSSQTNTVPLVGTTPSVQTNAITPIKTELSLPKNPVTMVKPLTPQTNPVTFVRTQLPSLTNSVTSVVTAPSSQIISAGTPLLSQTNAVKYVGTKFVKPDPVVWGKSMEARMRLPKKRPYPGDIDCSDSYISDDGQTSPMTSPNLTSSEPSSSPRCADVTSSLSPRYESTCYNSTFDSNVPCNNQMWCEVASKDYDKTESSNSRATRKSKRRNRGQRYLELINEGIIQPSKERLAAIRTESLSSVDDSPSDEDWKLDVGEEVSPVKSRSDGDKSDCDHSRYKSGDFDLEAHIATLPPCSMDALSKKKRRHTSGGSHNSNNNNSSGSGNMYGGKPSQQDEDIEMSMNRPPHVKLESTIIEEAITGSRKRKARKHKITHLISVQPNTSSVVSSAASNQPKEIRQVSKTEQISTPPSSQNKNLNCCKKEEKDFVKSVHNISHGHSTAFIKSEENTKEMTKAENICVGLKSASVENVVTSVAHNNRMTTTTTTYKTNIVMKECKKFDIYEFSEDSDGLEGTPALTHTLTDKPFGASLRKVHHRLVSKQIE